MKHEVIAEWQLVRRKLKITFRDTITVEELKELLKEIPDSATLDEIVNSDGERAALIFHHEYDKDNG